MSAKHRDWIAALNKDAKVKGWWEGEMLRIADGETLFDLCKSRGISFGTYRNWIAADDDREEQYLKANGRRGEFRRESVSKRVYGVAMTTVKKDDIRPSDMLKAAEMVLNPKGPEITLGGSGTGKITIIHESN